MNWWQEKPLRLLQTNLREIDLPFDVEAYAQSIEEIGANVALVNLGGIVANYPTQLPFHYRNPRLQDDLFAELIPALHRRGIHLIGRFDFSKVNETIGAAHPEWLYRSLSGETVTYNGQMQCCVNGAYQQERSLDILAEALARYPLDGVFFNMIGYQTRDYSGVYHGPCQCDNCRRLFHEYSGADLPTHEDRADPVYQRYLHFCDDTSRALFRRIRDEIKNRRPGCAICTYTDEGVDIIRSESNSGIRRVQPEFVYDASLNVRRVYGSWPGLAAANTAVHFIDFPYRHAGVSPALTARRIAQSFIHGGWPDYYIIGHLHQQHDRAVQPDVKGLFHLHKKAEGWLANTSALADACLIAPTATGAGRSPDELRGLLTLLSEAHILYDVVEETALSRALQPGQPGPTVKQRLARYPLVIVPDMPQISPGLSDALQAYAQNGGRLLLTGLSASTSTSDSEPAQPALPFCGISTVQPRPHTPGTYFAVAPEDRAALPGLEDVDWIPLDTPWLDCAPVEGARSYLRFVPVGMYGPPEKCYYTEITSRPGLIIQQVGQGLCAVLPWQIGSQYYRFATHAVARLFQAVLEGPLARPRLIHLEAPPTVEISAFTCPAEGALVIGLVNLSGQNGRAIHAPLPVYDLRFHLRPGAPLSRVETLTQGEIASVQEPDGSLSFTLPRLDLLEMIRVS